MLVIWFGRMERLLTINKNHSMEAFFDTDALLLLSLQNDGTTDLIDTIRIIIAQQEHDQRLKYKRIHPICIRSSIGITCDHKLICIVLDDHSPFTRFLVPNIGDHDGDTVQFFLSSLNGCNNGSGQHTH